MTASQSTGPSLLVEMFPCKTVAWIPAYPKEKVNEGRQTFGRQIIRAMKAVQFYAYILLRWVKGITGIVLPGS